MFRREVRTRRTVAKRCRTKRRRSTQKLHSLLRKNRALRRVENGMRGRAARIDHPSNICSAFLGRLAPSERRSSHDLQAAWRERYPKDEPDECQPAVRLAPKAESHKRRSSRPHRGVGQGVRSQYTGPSQVQISECKRSEEHTSEL